MRICLYTETALPKIGGQELVVDALARRFTAAGHHVVVLAPHPRSPLRPDDAILPYPVVRHPRFYSTRFLVGWYRRWLLGLHRAHRFDLLHCHGIYPAGYLAALCRSHLGAATVITSHGGDVKLGNVRLAKSTLHFRHVRALEAADALVAISRFTYEGLTRLCPQTRKLVHIPNGVDLDLFSTPVCRPERLDPAIRPGEYVLFLGRLKRRKGVDLLLEAMALVPASGQVQLVIAGEGEERVSLESQVSRLKLAQRVRFVGQTLGAAKIYLLQNALCAVVPSRHWEAFPLVVLECYAAGIPVIATKIPGLGDLIQPGRTGILVPPEAPMALARVLHHFLEHRVATWKLGEQARRVAQHYSWDAIAREHLRLYAELRAGRSCKSLFAWRLPRSPADGHEQRPVPQSVKAKRLQDGLTRKVWDRWLDDDQTVHDRSTDEDWLSWEDNFALPVEGQSENRAGQAR